MKKFKNKKNPIVKNLETGNSGYMMGLDPEKQAKMNALTGIINEPKKRKGKK
jgi:hypothetical protein